MEVITYLNMKRKFDHVTSLRIIIFFVLIQFSIQLKAQIVKTSESESSILFKNTNLGLDIGKTEGSFSWLNYRNTVLYKPNSIIWGVNAKGSLSNDIASIVNSSEIQPSSQLSGVLGFTTSNGKSYTRLITQEITDLSKEKEALELKLDTTVYKDLKAEIEEVDSVDANSSDKIIGLLDSLKKKDYPYQNLAKWAETEKAKTADTDLVFFYTLIQLSTQNNKDIARYAIVSTRLKEGLNALADAVLKKSYSRWNFYSHFGWSGQKYNVFKRVDTVSLDNSIEDESFGGFIGGFGVNWKYNGNWNVGIRYTYQESNTLYKLTASEYKLTNTFQATNGNTYTTETKKSAYPDVVDEVFLNRIDLDIMRSFKLNDDYILFLDIYYRHTQSNNQENFTRRTDIGVSSSFFKSTGKFVGGVYVELPDVNQNAEKRKPEPELEPVVKRLSFGVYARFSFTSLLGLSD